MTYQVELPGGIAFGITVSDEGVVTSTAPIGRWMRGKMFARVEKWVRGKGGSIQSVPTNGRVGETEWTLYEKRVLTISSMSAKY